VCGKLLETSTVREPPVQPLKFPVSKPPLATRLALDIVVMSMATANRQPAGDRDA
jgi:hypothetical protein